MPRTLVVSWVQPVFPNAPSLSYVVTYAAAASGVEMTAMTQGDLTVTITGLSPFTNYSITVQACSAGGCGQQSTEIIALTTEEGIMSTNGIEHLTQPLYYYIVHMPMHSTVWEVCRIHCLTTPKLSYVKRSKVTNWGDSNWCAMARASVTGLVIAGEVSFQIKFYGSGKWTSIEKSWACSVRRLTGQAMLWMHGCRYPQYTFTEAPTVLYSSVF